MPSPCKTPPGRRDKSAIFLLIPRKEAQEMVVEALSEQATEVRLLYAGQEVFAYGARVEGNVARECHATGMNLVAGGGMFGATRRLACHRRCSPMEFYSLRCFWGPYCSPFPLTIVIVRPLNEMILRFGGASDDLDAPFRFIYAYVDAFARKHERLNQENDSLRESRERILALMHNEIFLGMLTNPEYDFEAEYVRIGFPWVAQEKTVPAGRVPGAAGSAALRPSWRAGLRASAMDGPNLFAVLVRGRRARHRKRAKNCAIAWRKRAGSTPFPRCKATRARCTARIARCGKNWQSSAGNIWNCP